MSLVILIPERLNSEFGKIAFNDSNGFSYSIFILNALTDGSRTPVAVKPLEVGEEQIVLLNRNQERGVAFLGKVDDMGRQTGRLMSFVELARVKDSYDYMIKSYLGVRVKYPNTCAAIIRNVKRS